jgi:hypothetical protein
MMIGALGNDSLTHWWCATVGLFDLRDVLRSPSQQAREAPGVLSPGERSAGAGCEARLSASTC